MEKVKEDSVIYLFKDILALRSEGILRDGDDNWLDLDDSYQALLKKKNGLSSFQSKTGMDILSEFIYLLTQCRCYYANWGDSGFYSFCKVLMLIAYYSDKTGYIDHITVEDYANYRGKPKPVYIRLSVYKGFDPGHFNIAVSSINIEPGPEYNEYVFSHDDVVQRLPNIRNVYYTPTKDIQYIDVLRKFMEKSPDISDWEIQKTENDMNVKKSAVHRFAEIPVLKDVTFYDELRGMHLDFVNAYDALLNRDDGFRHFLGRDVLSDFMNVILNRYEVSAYLGDKGEAASFYKLLMLVAFYVDEYPAGITNTVKISDSGYDMDGCVYGHLVIYFDHNDDGPNPLTFSVAIDNYPGRTDDDDYMTMTDLLGKLSEVNHILSTNMHGYVYLDLFNTFLSSSDKLHITNINKKDISLDRQEKLDRGSFFDHFKKLCEYYVSEFDNIYYARETWIYDTYLKCKPKFIYELIYTGGIPGIELENTSFAKKVVEHYLFNRWFSANTIIRDDMLTAIKLLMLVSYLVDIGEYKFGDLDPIDINFPHYVKFDTKLYVYISSDSDNVIRKIHMNVYTPEEFKDVSDKVDVKVDISNSAHFLRTIDADDLNEILDNFTDKLSFIYLFSNEKKICSYEDNAFSRENPHKIVDKDGNEVDETQLEEESLSLKMHPSVNIEITDRAYFTENSQELEKENGSNKEINTLKEDNNMSIFKKFFPNIEFGKVKTDKIRFSHLGIAVENAEGVFVAYDAVNNSIVNVDALSLKGDEILYMIPCNVTQIKAGDTIINNGDAYYVTGRSGKANNQLSTIKPYDGSKGTILPTMTMFGFGIVTKVVSMIDFMNGQPDGNPFANMLPLMILADGKDGGSNDMMQLMVMSQMMGGNMNGNQMMSNPLFMMALMDGKGDDDTLKQMLMLQMMSGGNMNIFPQQAVKQNDEKEKEGKESDIKMGFVQINGGYTNRDEPAEGYTEADYSK